MPKRKAAPFPTNVRSGLGRQVKRTFRTRVVRKGAYRSALFRSMPYARAAVAGYYGYRLMKKYAARRRIMGTPKKAIALRDYVVGSESSFSNITRKTLLVNAINHNAGVGASTLRGMATKKFYLSGMKMCLKYRSNANFATRIHYCILQQKEDNADTGQPSVSKDFFASKSDETNRMIDFENGGNWTNEQDCNPINNRKFNILFHKTFTLAARMSDQQDNVNLNNWKVIQKWIPIKKTFEYENPEDPVLGNVVRKPLLYVTWYDFVRPGDQGAIAPMQANVSFDSYCRAVG